MIFVDADDNPVLDVTIEGGAIKLGGLKTAAQAAKRFLSKPFVVSVSEWAEGKTEAKETVKLIVGGIFEHPALMRAGLLSLHQIGLFESKQEWMPLEFSAFLEPPDKRVFGQGG